MQRIDHPGAGQRDKFWPQQRFTEVANRLADEFGGDIVLTDSAVELTSWLRWPAICAPRRASLLVCNDTGVSHIAAGLRVKSVLQQGRHRALGAA